MKLSQTLVVEFRGLYSFETKKIIKANHFDGNCQLTLHLLCDITHLPATLRVSLMSS